MKHLCTSCLFYKLGCLPFNLFVAVFYVSWMSPFRHTDTHTYVCDCVRCVCCVHTCISDINVPVCAWRAPTALSPHPESQTVIIFPCYSFILPFSKLIFLSQSRLSSMHGVLSPVAISVFPITGTPVPARPARSGSQPRSSLPSGHPVPTLPAAPAASSCAVLV